MGDVEALMRTGAVTSFAIAVAQMIGVPFYSAKIDCRDFGRNGWDARYAAQWRFLRWQCVICVVNATVMTGILVWGPNL